MPQNSIPKRDPVGDTFTGYILKQNDRKILSTQPGDNIIAEGDFIVRYGVRFLGKHHLAIVPRLIALDYGDMLTGENAWDFLLNKSNLYPRGEVFGYRQDGVDDMIVIKYLDLTAPFMVLVYADAQATTPLHRVEALITTEDDAIAPRLRVALADES
jgi:hypothetical protein